MIPYKTLNTQNKSYSSLINATATIIFTNRRKISDTIQEIHRAISNNRMSNETRPNIAATPNYTL